MSKIDQPMPPEWFLTIMPTNTSSIYEIDLAFSRINKPCMYCMKAAHLFDLPNDFVRMLIFVLQ